MTRESDYRLIFAVDEGRSLTRTTFLRALGLVYFCAFASLWLQVRGLAGVHGILPAADFLQGVREQLSGFERYYLVPSFCWLNASDTSLLLQCASGTVLAFVLMAGIMPGPILIGLWFLWLSLTSACRDFLGFQWENLLLESGLLAIFLAPWTRSFRTAPPPPRLMIWLFWWLIFRLMFLSGMVKILSADPAWRDLTALSYHYETQPLPTAFGWYAWHLPGWVHRCETAIMYVIELGLPFLIFAGRRARTATAIGFALLQVGIAVTGNYCYFNLLTAILCLPLLDDATLQRFLPRLLLTVNAQPRIVRFPLARQITLTLFAVFVLVTTSLNAAITLQLLEGPPGFYALLRSIQPFRSINNYALFAVMTKTRPEIIVEGSADGQTWLSYEFRYKPGDLKQRPKFVAPHQPRLDWQMWFAALSSAQQNPWFINFCVRLLQGTPEVLELLRTNPFPNAPPKYIRATLYNYEFTDRATLKKTGDWWKREYIGPYLGPISLREK